MQKRDKKNNSIERMLTLLSLYEDDRLEHKIALSQEETQILEAARQTENFLDKMPGGFFIYHSDGNKQLIYANAAVLRIFGCNDLEEFRKLTDNSFDGIVHPDDRGWVNKSIEEQIAQSQEDLDYVEYRIIRKDGVVRWVEDYGHFVHSETIGDVYYVFISDATEKINLRLSEKDILINEKREKEEKLQNLIVEHDKERSVFRQEELQRFKVIEGLSVNYDTILYADLDRNEVSPYRLGSRTAYYFDEKLQVLNYKEILADYANTWVHPEDRALVSEMTDPDFIRKKLLESKTFYINYRCIEDGKIKFLQLRIVNVGSNRHISQIVLGYRSIDDEILNEMKQKSVLQEALKSSKLASVAKNTFLSNMSHDMRTPLNAIFGYTALAKKSLDNKNLVSDYLEKIDTASKQILSLINNVLELAYLESQDLKLAYTECNVCNIVQSVHKKLLPQAEQKHISFSLNTNTRHSDVYSDKDKLSQVILHLADNAIKYTKDGGSVDITVIEKTDENLSGEHSTYQFIVKDTGIGISEDALAHIFEPFEREYDTTHAGIYGLGLGLTIVKQIVGRMGGNIKAESEVGKGSVFTVTLDLRRQVNGQTNSAEAVPELDLSGKKILIVEDNQINLEIETELLNELGCVVDSAVNGKIAVDMIKNAKPKEYLFVLMDIQMPVMDGRQATEAIRKLENPDLATIPVIALSANAFESDVKASKEAGMNAHLTKPIDIPLLLKTIKSIV